MLFFSSDISGYIQSEVQFFHLIRQDDSRNSLINKHDHARNQLFLNQRHLDRASHDYRCLVYNRNCRLWPHPTRCIISVAVTWLPFFGSHFLSFFLSISWPRFLSQRHVKPPHRGQTVKWEGDFFRTVASRLNHFLSKCRVLSAGADDDYRYVFINFNKNMEISPDTALRWDTGNFCD